MATAKKPGRAPVKKPKKPTARREVRGMLHQVDVPKLAKLMRWGADGPSKDTATFWGMSVDDDGSADLELELGCAATSSLELMLRHFDREEDRDEFLHQLMARA